MPHHHGHHHGHHEHHEHHEEHHEEHHHEGPPPHVDYIPGPPMAYPPPGAYPYPPQGPPMPPQGYYPPQQLPPMASYPTGPGYVAHDPSIGSAGMIQPTIGYNPGMPAGPPIGSAGMVESYPTSNIGHANEGEVHHKHGIIHKLFHKKHDH